MVAAAVVVVGATVVAVVVVVVPGVVVGGAPEVDVAAAVVVLAGRVVVVAGCEFAGVTVVVVEPPIGTVMLGSSTNGSAGTGRPAMATPAKPPTAMTARANGQDLRMSSAS